MSDKTNKEIDAHSGTETTGHEWDGIKELNTPLPRWWLYIFYASIIWSVVYWVLMPAWPGLPGSGGATQGVRGHSDRVLVAEAMTQLDADRAENAKALLTASLEEIESSPELLQFATAMGESQFGDNCATCHGAGGRGAVGYPVLADDVWIWGGTLEDIEFTLTHGIRSTSDDTRFNEMPAYGGELGFMSDEQVSDLTQYVLNLSGQEADAAAVARATTDWVDNCTACHGDNGEGVQELGGPDLTDADWLYESTAEGIYAQIYSPRNSIMPAWQDRLDESTIKALAVYVHGLGGGE